MTTPRVVAGQIWQMHIPGNARWMEVQIEEVRDDTVWGTFSGTTIQLTESVMLANPDKFRLMGDPQ
jgi:hypothetical protein